MKKKRGRPPKLRPLPPPVVCLLCQRPRSPIDRLCPKAEDGEHEWSDGQSGIDPREEFGEKESAYDAAQKEIMDAWTGRTDLDSTPPSWVNKLHVDSRINPLRIVALFRSCHLEERKVGQILRHAGLSSEGRLGFEFIPAMGALIEYYKRHSEKAGRTENAEQERRKKWEADTAELKARELRGELCPMSAAKQFWSDARIELRKVVELAPYLTKEQKVQLLGAFQRLKSELKVGEEEI